MHEDKLYAIAMECAKIHCHGQCKCDCHVCQYNIYNYVDDTKEASLLKATAFADYRRRLEVMQPKDDGCGMFALIALVVLLLMCCGACGPRDDLGALKRYTPLQVTPEVRYLLANQNQVENVPRVLEVMRTQGVRDVNLDGQINCIDNSLTFRYLYGSRARLIINSKLNHMFISIYLPDGDTAFIEPQGTSTWYSMGQVWGMRYHPYYNKDVTAIWGLIPPASF